MGSGPSKNKQQALQRQQVSYQTDPVDANTPLARTKGGTFHIAEKGSDTNPDGSKNYVHLPQRNHKDLASRQMDVRRVPGRTARGNGKQVFYIRMKRPTPQLGDTWAQATHEADTLAAKQGITQLSPPRVRQSHSEQAVTDVISPSAVLASSAFSPQAGLPSEPASASAQEHGSTTGDASDSDAAGGESGWQQSAPGDAAAAAAGDDTRRDLHSDFAGQAESTPA